MAFNCDERANVIQVEPTYVYSTAFPPLLGCVNAHLLQCQKVRSIHHRNAAGAIVRPYMMCPTCTQQRNRILNRNRRRITQPAAAVWQLRRATDALNGPEGAHTRGKLCTTCITYEIAAYYNRRFVDRQNVQKAARTCKCEKEFAKEYCVKDRAKLCEWIQEESDLNAGPGGWLEHIEFNNVTNRAEFNDFPGPMVAARAARGMLRNACRCGRDVVAPPAAPGPGLPAPPAPIPPVIACTACSGILLDPHHAQVTGFTNWQGALVHNGEVNMAYGRPLDP